eukprot:247251-Chlamydomonas_euryale.AAC.5
MSRDRAAAVAPPAAGHDNVAQGTTGGGYMSDKPGTSPMPRRASAWKAAPVPVMTDVHWACKRKSDMAHGSPLPLGQKKHIGC